MLKKSNILNKNLIAIDFNLKGIDEKFYTLENKSKF